MTRAEDAYRKWAWRIKNLKYHQKRELELGRIKTGYYQKLPNKLKKLNAKLDILDKKFSKKILNYKKAKKVIKDKIRNIYKEIK